MVFIYLFTIADLDGGWNLPISHNYVSHHSTSKVAVPAAAKFHVTL